jgi:hypothetical protein
LVKPAGLNLITDQGLVDDFKNVKWQTPFCVPQKLLPGMIWDPVESFRQYTLGNKRAIASVAYQKPGSRVLIMQSQWASPPWISDPAGCLAARDWMGLGTQHFAG